MKRFLLFFLASVTLVGCSWDDPSTKLIEALKREALEKQEQSVQPGIEFYSEFDAAPVVPGESDETPIYFNSNMGWKAEATSSWFSISPKEGEPGDGSVVIKAEANEEFDTRSGKITFTSGYRTFTITVVQSPKSAIILEKDSFEVGKDGGTITVVVKTTVGFETVVPREYSKWIGFEPYTKSLETRYVQLNIARNKGAERTGYVDFVNYEKGLSKRVFIKQETGLPDGALSGEFSVSATKKVHFSKGNLVATINDSGAPTAWKFATNQYDYIGEGGANKTIGMEAGDIDLFGWSTASTTYGISTSITAGDYSGGFVDWGKNIGDGNTWRTLSKDEWTYLFNTRTVNDGKGAGKSYSLNITYGGKMGVVLYPDDYTGSVLSGTVDSLPEGVVFLPAAGYRNGSRVLSVGGDGDYWSSSASGESRAYCVDFSSSYVYPGEYFNRFLGYSVRLVTEVPAK